MSEVDELTFLQIIYNTLNKVPVNFRSFLFNLVIHTQVDSFYYFLVFIHNAIRYFFRDLKLVES